jgi:hypothetical protein
MGRHFLLCNALVDRTVLVPLPTKWYRLRLFDLCCWYINQSVSARILLWLNHPLRFHLSGQKRVCLFVSAPVVSASKQNKKACVWLLIAPHPLYRLLNYEYYRWLAKHAQQLPYAPLLPPLVFSTVLESMYDVTSLWFYFPARTNMRRPVYSILYLTHYLIPYHLMA